VNDCRPKVYRPAPRELLPDELEIAQTLTLQYLTISSITRASIALENFHGLWTRNAQVFASDSNDLNLVLQVASGLSGGLPCFSVDSELE
jgi:hypothetical protein